MCMNYADLENNLGEIDKARAIYTFASQFADAQYDTDFWSKWLEFEVRHGNPRTFQEMLQNNRTDDKIDIAQKADIPSKLKVVETNKDKHRHRDTELDTLEKIKRQRLG
ncbi:pre-mRNA-splicing factor SYF1-like [Thalictrum thalictroides]|uniref:Pre-mRNA-splicing factor SYF1-like n=1 Tax=Thalictrum thalictroides TaxID=46969 RepID=A0A7J6WAB3_THATH|nr:pre-mRNA-splicing factor SYF1-like [Thalictrum thalictroides]